MQRSEQKCAPRDVAPPSPGAPLVVSTNHALRKATPGAPAEGNISRDKMSANGQFLPQDVALSIQPALPGAARRRNRANGKTRVSHVKTGRGPRPGWTPRDSGVNTDTIYWLMTSWYHHVVVLLINGWAAPQRNGSRLSYMIYAPISWSADAMAPNSVRKSAATMSYHVTHISVTVVPFVIWPRHYSGITFAFSPSLTRMSLHRSSQCLINEHSLFAHVTYRQTINVSNRLTICLLIIWPWLVPEFQHTLCHSNWPIPVRNSWWPFLYLIRLWHEVKPPSSYPLIRPSLVRVLACCLLCFKPLSEPRLLYS